MGQAILYCYRCSTQLRDSHFEQGKAYKIDGYAVCAACAPDALKSLPAESVQKLLDQIAGRGRKEQPVSQRKTGAALPALRESSRATHIVTSSSTATPNVKTPARNPWILVGAVGGAVLVLGIVVLLSRDQAPPPVHETASSIPAPVPVKAAVKPAPTDSAAQIALKAAIKFADDHPSDLEGQIKLFSDLTLLSDRGEAGSEAKKRVESLRARDAEVVQQALGALNREIEDLFKPDKYSEALRTVEAAKSRLTSTSWKLAVEKRAHEIRTLIADSKKPAPPPPPPPPPPATRSAESKAYEAAWLKVLPRATSRDYAGAAADLKKELAGLKEEDVRREAAQDVADLEELDRVYKATIAAALGEKTLDLRAASGRVLAADADRVELFTDPKQPTVFVEWLNVRADGLVPLLKMQATDPRIPLLFAVLDGSAESTEGLASKLAAYKATPPRPVEDAAVRELYYAAERDWRLMETRDKSIDAYKALRTKHKDAPLVKRLQARIDRRAESGKEYTYTASDLAFSGTFAPTRDDKLESIADSDPAQAPRNWAELEYAPLPSSTYRCWILVGGCCAETLTFYYQATGLTELNPKTKKKVAADPGSDAAVETRPAVKGLKPAHAKEEPKKATRWDWVELTIPKVSAPGTRRVRILTSQRGFTVAAVVVSATRTKPPTDAELAELVKARALDAVPGWVVGRSGSSLRIVIDDFEVPGKTWAWVGGWEFPGAKGSYAIDPSTGHESKASGKIEADFSGGGAYVGGWRDLQSFSNRNFKEIRIWIKSPNITGIGVRLADNTDQVHQRHLNFKPSPDWQEIILRPKELAGGEHWAGANDGVWHGPIKAFGINIGKGSFTAGAAKGDFWFDDIEGLLEE